MLRKLRNQRSFSYPRSRSSPKVSLRTSRLSAIRFYQDDETGERRSFDRAHSHKWRGEGGQAVWDNLRALDAAHVTEWAVYSANGRTPEHDEYAYNRPQRPLGVLRNGRQVLNTPESRPAFMAFLVYKLKQADGQLTESLPQLIEEWQSSGWVFAFENASVSHVEGVSVLRLTHRAATDNAKVWYRDLCQECDRAFFSWKWPHGRISRKYLVSCRKFRTRQISRKLSQ